MMIPFKRFSFILWSLIFLLLLYLLLNSSMKYSKFWTILQSDLNYYDFLEDNMTQSFQRNYMLNRNIDNDRKFLYPYRNGFIRAKWSFLKDFDNILAGLNLLDDDYDILSNGFVEEISLKDNYAFVTAFSDNHFREALYLLKSMMQVYGNETLLKYFSKYI
uniref:Uncharacterized protein n=1 Tax=Romanomermis culicivorax TaxID=13658 RepID=A0A915JV47_ROMCU